MVYFFLSFFIVLVTGSWRLLDGEKEAAADWVLQMSFDRPALAVCVGSRLHLQCAGVTRGVLKCLVWTVP